MLLLKNLLFTVLVPGTVAVLVPRMIATQVHLAPGGTLFGACLLFALGGPVYFWCLRDFATLGRGTPAPIDETRVLVTLGLYRLVRNPMYLGVLTFILGWVVLLPSRNVVAYLVTVATCFHLGRLVRRAAARAPVRRRLRGIQI